ncbi:asparagine--tRNA ligase [Methanocella arvoryzae]|uniref:Asparagine--tRNA ligase n=1 Tax=Methanocella arvoryzae (strain DSM 22066 / NBRC 105507 / MRE50) TaxID=351160 RepID=Q0W3J1_METAR|nr:asparagine--tRNA ligase [Methanocella arvoryzae]CAJ37052.1 asparaginyl-tRNA synthetase [Methanocella arvoryzae MRE50]
MFVKIKDILAGKYPDGEEVQVGGWVVKNRSSGKIVFTVIRDSSGEIQVTTKKGNVCDDALREADALSLEASTIIKGKVRTDPRAPGGRELVATDVKIVGASRDYPIFGEGHNPEVLLDLRHLHIRSKELVAIMKVKDSVLSSCREWFRASGFYEVTPPIIMSSSCEGGSTLFELKYFDEKAYLSQSAQLYLESLIFGLEKVYSVTPSFRAEKSRTTRHLAEYWHIEGEMAWVGLYEMIDMLEQLVSYVCNKTAEERHEELRMLGSDPEYFKNLKPPFPRITYDEAVKILQADGFDFKWGDDFGTHEERQLSMHYDKPLFITEYPLEVKAFYMKDAGNAKVLNVDMIAPRGFGEIIGGSERETDLALLEERIRKQGEDPAKYGWYLDLRRYGSVPHSGFGMGAERLVRWICNQEHIRDTIPYPRTISRFNP